MHSKVISTHAIANNKYGGMSKDVTMHVMSQVAHDMYWAKLWIIKTHHFPIPVSIAKTIFIFVSEYNKRLGAIYIEYMIFMFPNFRPHNFTIIKFLIL